MSDIAKEGSTMHGTVMIDPEFANLCRPLTTEEKAQLEEDLVARGCLDSLKAWGDILLDGHNRHEICHRRGIAYDLEQVPGIETREQAFNWVIANQLGRRNLIPEDVSYLRGKRYHAEKISDEDHLARLQAIGTAAAARARAGDSTPDIQRYQNGTVGRTAEKLGKEFGVGSTTIHRDAAFAAAVDKIGEKLGKETADMIRTGKSGLPKKTIREFAAGDDLTIQKLNDLRFQHQQRRVKQRKEHKKSAPKAPPLTRLKKSENALDVTYLDRIRPFMNAVIQIATSPVTAATLAGYRWPDNWRKQMQEALPGSIDYLNAFTKAFNQPKEESTNGHDQNEAA